MFKLQELPSGQIKVFHGNSNKLAMIISNSNKENDVSLPDVETTKTATRPAAENQLSTANTNVTVDGSAFPYISLPKVKYFNDNEVGEAEQESKDWILCESPTSETDELCYAAENQDSFLGVFGLQPSELLNLSPNPTNTLALIDVPLIDPDADSIGVRRKSISRRVVNEVEFSAHLGEVLASRIPGRTIEPESLLQQQVSRYEAYCGDFRFCRGTADYPVCYLTDSENEDDEEGPPNQHRMCFNVDQRLERRRSIKYGLSTTARILKRQCKRSRVQLTRLSESVIQDWTSRKDPVRKRAQILSKRNACFQRNEVIIDGTIVIQLDDSDDDTFTTMPKLSAQAGSVHRALTTTTNTTTNGYQPRVVSIFKNKTLDKSEMIVELDWHGSSVASAAKRIKMSADDDSSNASGSSFANYSNNCGLIESSMTRSPQKIWSPNAKSQSRTGSSRNGKPGNRSRYVANVTNSSCDDDASSDDDIVFLGVQPRFSRPPIMHHQFTGSERGDGDAKIKLESLEHGNLTASAKTTINECFVPLERRGVSVHAVHHSHSSNGEILVNGHSKDNAVLVERVTGGGGGASTTTTTTSAPRQFISNRTSTLSSPNCGYHCRFQCLKCDTSQTYRTNSRDATRSIHEHVLRCHPNAELVVNLDEYEIHGVVHVQAF